MKNKREREREKETRCRKDVMQKIKVEHIGNNVILIFQVSFFRCLQRRRAERR